MEPADLFSGLESGEVFQSIRENFQTRESPISPCSLTLLDTFDWRLYRHDQILVCTPLGDEYLLSLSRLDRREERKIHVNRVPGFEWDLPESTFRSTIAPLITIRRLLPLTEARLAGRRLEILNDDEKTIARIESISVTTTPCSSASALPPLIRIRSLKGYETDTEAVIRFIQERFDGGVPHTSLVGWILEAAGKRPLSYSSKLKIQLDAGMSTYLAARTIYRDLFNTIRANEDGVRQNLDSEFLHDFRVAVRRTRSALSQLKRVFPDAATKHFRKEFSWLGTVTNPTRDLDVYLLKMEVYKSSLPPGPARHLGTLAEFLEGRHKKEHRLLIRALNCSRYRRLLADWEAFLNEPAPDPNDLSPWAAAPVTETANSRILKVYKRILKKGGRIRDETPAEALHELRIEAKKLRYLMEFFRSLYPKNQIGSLIKSLRRLQDNLGEFNDCHLQQLALYKFAEQLITEGRAEAETLMAMGRLVERMEVSQEEERKRFKKYFERFARRENRDRFEQLFRSNTRLPETT